MERRKAKVVKIGNISIGGDFPIAVQSMLNVRSSDIEGNVEQAKRLKSAGCEIIRASIPDDEAVKLVYAVKEATGLPFVADIHFSHRLAIEAVNAGADKIRINPGNIGSESRVKEVVDCCRLHNVPIRVGVNSGSVERELLAKYGGPVPQALVESAMNHVKLIEKYDYDNIVISIKSSDTLRNVESYRLIASQCDYPLHLGVTEAGTSRMGLIKSSVGIGSLLLDGIGDTIRVSLTADPTEEISAGFDILKACGIRSDSVNIISCPTCGRTKVSMIPLAEKVEKAFSTVKKPITVAVMGCAVNGPGEAREADIGVACGDGCGLIFKKGEIIGKVDEDKILDELLKLAEEL